MVPLIDPVPKERLAAELDESKKILNFRGVDVYAFTAAEAPDVMREIGRIREREFRFVGAGRDVPADIDGLDTGPGCYRQLVAWDPENREIVGAYRYVLCGDLLRGPGLGRLRTAGLFEFSAALLADYLPCTVELGRSVVNREAKKAIMGLFVVWSGLGALIREYPEIRYFFGNFSVYSSYPDDLKDLLIRFLELHHPDKDKLLRPKQGLEYRIACGRIYPFTGSYGEDYDRLIGEFGKRGTFVPPILLSYLGANRDLRYLAAARDADFAGAVECAILVPVANINEKTRKRFIEGYECKNPERFAELRK
jgi:hypothetical protein